MHRHFDSVKVLHDPKAETGTGSPAPQDNNTPAVTTTTAAPVSTAAEVVLHGKNQREMELEQKLLEESAARRKAEMDAADALDQVSQLKEIDSRRPAPSRKPRNSKPFSWSPIVETEVNESTEEV